MTPRPHVAMISFGPRDSTGWLARALAPHARVDLLVPREMADYVGPEVGDGVRMRAVDWPRSSHPAAQLKRTAELVRLVRSLDPDVVHLQQGHHLFNAALGRLRGLPLVVTVHEPTAPRRPRHQRRRMPQAAMDLAFRRADRIIVHGEALRAPVTRRGVEAGAIHVVPRAAPQQIDPGRPFARVGEELDEPGLRELSLVGATYGLQHRTLGAVSLVGPLRMDYEKALRSVRSAAHELSRFVEEAYGED